VYITIGPATFQQTLIIGGQTIHFVSLKRIIGLRAETMKIHEGYHPRAQQWLKKYPFPDVGNDKERTSPTSAEKIITRLTNGITLPELKQDYTAKSRPWRHPYRLKQLHPEITSLLENIQQWQNEHKQHEILDNIATIQAIIGAHKTQQLLNVIAPQLAKYLETWLMMVTLYEIDGYTTKIKQQVPEWQPKVQLPITNDKVNKALSELGITVTTSNGAQQLQQLTINDIFNIFDTVIAQLHQLHQLTDKQYTDNLPDDLPKIAPNLNLKEATLKVEPSLKTGYLNLSHQSENFMGIKNVKIYTTSHWVLTEDKENKKNHVIIFPSPISPPSITMISRVQIPDTTPNPMQVIAAELQIPTQETTEDEQARKQQLNTIFQFASQAQDLIFNAAYSSQGELDESQLVNMKRDYATEAKKAQNAIAKLNQANQAMINNDYYPQGPIKDAVDSTIANLQAQLDAIKKMPVIPQYWETFLSTKYRIKFQPQPSSSADIAAAGELTDSQTDKQTNLFRLGPNLLTLLSSTKQDSLTTTLTQIRKTYPPQDKVYITLGPTNFQQTIKMGEQTIHIVVLTKIPQNVFAFKSLLYRPQAQQWLSSHQITQQVAQDASAAKRERGESKHQQPSLQDIIKFIQKEMNVKTIDYNLKQLTPHLESLSEHLQPLEWNLGNILERSRARQSRLIPQQPDTAQLMEAIATLSTTEPNLVEPQKLTTLLTDIATIQYFLGIDKTQQILQKIAPRLAPYFLEWQLQSSQQLQSIQDKLHLLKQKIPDWEKPPEIHLSTTIFPLQKQLQDIGFTVTVSQETFQQQITLSMQEKILDILIKQLQTIQQLTDQQFMAKRHPKVAKLAQYADLKSAQLFILMNEKPEPTSHIKLSINNSSAEVSSLKEIQQFYIFDTGDYWVQCVGKERIAYFPQGIDTSKEPIVFGFKDAQMEEQIMNSLTKQKLQDYQQRIDRGNTNTASALQKAINSPLSSSLPPNLLTPASTAATTEHSPDQTPPPLTVIANQLAIQKEETEQQKLARENKYQNEDLSLNHFYISAKKTQEATLLALNNLAQNNKKNIKKEEPQKTITLPPKYEKDINVEDAEKALESLSQTQTALARYWQKKKVEDDQQSLESLNQSQMTRQSVETWKSLQFSLSLSLSQQDHQSLESLSQYQHALTQSRKKIKKPLHQNEEIKKEDKPVRTAIKHTMTNLTYQLAALKQISSNRLIQWESSIYTKRQIITDIEDKESKPSVEEIKQELSSTQKAHAIGPNLLHLIPLLDDQIILPQVIEIISSLIEPELEPEPEAKVKAKTLGETKAEANANAKVKTVVEAVAKAKAEIKAVAKAKARAETKAELRAIAQTLIQIRQAFPSKDNVYITLGPANFQQTIKEDGKDTHIVVLTRINGKRAEVIKRHESYHPKAEKWLSSSKQTPDISTRDRNIQSPDMRLDTPSPMIPIPSNQRSSPAPLPTPQTSDHVKQVINRLEAWPSDQLKEEYKNNPQNNLYLLKQLTPELESIAQLSLSPTHENQKEVLTNIATIQSYMGIKITRHILEQLAPKLAPSFLEWQIHTSKEFEKIQSILDYLKNKVPHWQKATIHLPAPIRPLQKQLKDIGFKVTASTKGIPPQINVDTIIDILHSIIKLLRHLTIPLETKVSLSKFNRTAPQIIFNINPSQNSSTITAHMKLTDSPTREIYIFENGDLVIPTENDVDVVASFEQETPEAQDSIIFKWKKGKQHIKTYEGVHPIEKPLDNSTRQKLQNYLSQIEQSKTELGMYNAISRSLDSLTPTVLTQQDRSSSSLSPYSSNLSPPPMLRERGFPVTSPGPQQPGQVRWSAPATPVAVAPHHQTQNPLATLYQNQSAQEQQKFQNWLKEILNKETNIAAPSSLLSLPEETKEKINNNFANSLPYLITATPISAEELTSITTAMGEGSQGQADFYYLINNQKIIKTLITLPTLFLQWLTQFPYLNQKFYYTPFLANSQQLTLTDGTHAILLPSIDDKLTALYPLITSPGPQQPGSVRWSTPATTPVAVAPHHQTTSADQAHKNFHQAQNPLATLYAQQSTEHERQKFHDWLQAKINNIKGVPTPLDLAALEQRQWDKITKKITKSKHYLQSQHRNLKKLATTLKEEQHFEQDEIQTILRFLNWLTSSPHAVSGDLETLAPIIKKEFPSLQPQEIEKILRISIWLTSSTTPISAEELTSITTAMGERSRGEANIYYQIDSQKILKTLPTLLQQWLTNHPDLNLKFYYAPFLTHPQQLTLADGTHAILLPSIDNQMTALHEVLHPLLEENHPMRATPIDTVAVQAWLTGQGPNAFKVTLQKGGTTNIFAKTFQGLITALQNQDWHEAQVHLAHIWLAITDKTYLQQTSRDLLNNQLLQFLQRLLMGSAVTPMALNYIKTIASLWSGPTNINDLLKEQQFIQQVNAAANSLQILSRPLQQLIKNLQTFINTSTQMSSQFIQQLIEFISNKENVKELTKSEQASTVVLKLALTINDEEISAVALQSGFTQKMINNSIAAFIDSAVSQPLANLKAIVIVKRPEDNALQKLIERGNPWAGN